MYYKVKEMFKNKSILVKGKPKSAKIDMFKFSLPMFNCSIYVGFKDSFDKYRSLYDDYKSCDAICIDYLNYDRSICMFFDKVNINTISHECYHAVNNIFENIGHKADNKNDEVGAYMLGYLTKEVFNIARKEKFFK
jgi:hypothetical protein